MASELAAGEITRVGSEPRAAAKGGRAHFGRLSLGSLADQPVALSGLSLLLAFTDAPLAKAAAIPLMVFSALPIGTRAGGLGAVGVGSISISSTRSRSPSRLRSATCSPERWSLFS
ncbi:MAG TPA: hypothetical protein VEH77_14925 [Roseiarcus sp.]|nr:hypothetical protein [Roseiarcus sp.]